MNSNPFLSVDRNRALGYLAALAVVLVTAAYPALTRWSVTTSLTPADILLFRLGTSGLLFVPYLIRHSREIRRSEWLAALPLSFLHGWGMAGCVVFGLRYAPASHAAALGPGAIAAWIALIGFVAYRIEVDSKRLAGIAVIVGGVALILAASHSGHSLATALVGDAMFLAASALGATYLVYIQRRRLDPVLAAALVCVASAMIVVPWHYFFAQSAIASASVRELAWQIVFQGVVFGCGVAFAINFAVLAVGSQTVGVLSALVPVVGALCAMWIAGDRISDLEWIAIASISCGVTIACLPPRAAAWVTLRGRGRTSALAQGSASKATTVARVVPGGD
jgi:drug/metabolite transporter (DMT)-like permease